ncbi:NUDIX domain-containing protein [Sphingomonas sabuli]|uniref:NUDIX domain-containing protein n=1 Tax=Sphingomonas sabuli TaxID=2764186 RepID=A0A7G9L3G7_9SPHN|nr:NUDIX domain-containing protein [Sphingomonas sabuli]QNM83166.1 NUDIX domain-containing protein [Sphingomonas sabuli]
MDSAQAIPAATLVCVRERAGQPPALLMVERGEGMAFAAGALVFPGGRIDPGDAALGGAEAAAKVAAIRETIEETAIPVGLAPLPSAATALDMQTRLLGNAQFGAVLVDAGAALDLDALIPFARWVPKFHATRRFDTMFFLALCPDGWEPRIVAGECSAAHWIGAAEVLERDAAGTARLIFPTRRNLERLAQHDSFDAMRADALAHVIEPISPWVEERDGQNFITIPQGIGYPVTQERLDGLWRG